MTIKPDKDQFILNTIEIMQASVEGMTAEKESFSDLAFIVATKSASGADEIQLVSVSKMCGAKDCNDELTEEEFRRLLTDIAHESRACAVVRGYQDCPLGGPAVTVELPGEYYLTAPVDESCTKWFWVKKCYEAAPPVLHQNRAN